MRVKLKMNFGSAVLLGLRLILFPTKTQPRASRKKPNRQESNTITNKIMQSKISTFFNASSAAAAPVSPLLPSILDDGDLALWEKKEHEYINTYKRRARKPDGETADKGSIGENQKQTDLEDSCLKSEPEISGKNLSKKRSYAQLHLDLGQSDFLLHTCSTCGMKYTPGEKEDEKTHRVFHNSYTHGLKFKGWQREKIAKISLDGNRILVVPPCCHHAQRKKVEELVKLMEIDLGEGWIYHKRCQAYLFVETHYSKMGTSSQRIVGCLIAEPIKEAYKILPSSQDGGSNGATATTKKVRLKSTALKFGEVVFQREVMKRASAVNSHEVLDGNFNGAIFCEKEPVDAACGIRAIWVAQSKRRQNIATKLLDAVRNNFYIYVSILSKEPYVLLSQLAFSQPTSAGKALASKYYHTGSFLVYKAENFDREVVHPFPIGAELKRTST